MNIKAWLLRHRFTAAIFILSFAYFLIAPMSERLHYDFSPETYLVFHSIAEGISIIIAFMCFGITFHSYKLTRDSRNMILGVTFLAVGLIDIMHVLSYYGMPAFITENTVNKATQLWVAGRLVAGIGFIAAMSGNRYFKKFTMPYLMVAAALLVSLAVFAGVVLFPDRFPPMFVAGKGLTPLKIYLEYLVAIAMLAAGVMAYSEYRKTLDEHLPYFAAAMFILMFSELFFTLYADPYDIYNFMGHIYKTLGYFFVYRMLFITSIEIPYSELSNAKEVITSYASDLEGVVKIRTEELEQRNLELEHLNKLKTDFLAMCSHDIKTPIQSALLHIELLLEEADGPLNPVQARDLSIIRKNQKEIMELITNLLDLARQEQAGLALEEADVRLAEIINDCVSIHKSFANKMSIEFKLDMDGCRPDLVCRVDAPKLKQALNNLLSNAVKFTPKVGRIELTVVTDEEGGLIFKVFNTGDTIPESELGAIFDRYSRVNDPSRTQGTGLGLNIAKIMVELHGGRIWAENVDGAGVEFFIHIPHVIPDVTPPEEGLPSIGYPDDTDTGRPTSLRTN